MLYQFLKKIVGIAFNIVNILMAGNLPPFGCVCAVIEQDHHYLVVGLPNQDAAFPGGFMRWQEHPEQTALRECKEETGLDIRTRDVIGYQTYVSKRFDQMSTINIIYRAEVIGGTLRKSVEGQPYWLHETTLRAKLAPHYKDVFDAYLRTQHNLPKSEHDVFKHDVLN